MSAPLKCWTAPGEVFTTREELHEHYKSEWHKYNLKRKVASLAPIPRAMFEKLQMIQAEREREKKNVLKGKDHIKHTKRVADTMTRSAAAPPGPPGNESASLVSAQGDDADKQQQPTYEVDQEELKKAVDERVCFMDGHESEDLAGTLSYLHKQFGFFIPDAEYCVDLSGLFKYCTKKVRAGHMCLYCQKGFHNTESVIQHMRAKFHCKLPWEHEEDLEEYDEFYDYSPLGQEDQAGDSDDEEDQQDVEDEDMVSKGGKKVELMSTGELLLTDTETGKSKILGHRQFRHLYKQRVQTKEESRPAFLANSKERLLLLYKTAGVDTSSALTKPVQINGGRPAWMTKKLAQHQRRKIHYEKKLSLRDGVQINLQIKNRLHKGKNMGPGFGVHG